MTIGMQDVNQIQNQNHQAYSRQRISTFPIGKTIFNCWPLAAAALGTGCWGTSHLKFYNFYQSEDCTAFSVLLSIFSIAQSIFQHCLAFPPLLSILSITIFIIQP